MRTYKKLIAAAAVAATAAGLAVVPALADPPGAKAPSNAITGVGSDTIQNLFNQFSKDYNATKKASARPLYSWDATGSMNIQEKGSKTTDKNCSGPRPNGSGAGINGTPPLAIASNTVDKNPKSTGWCTDFARSSAGASGFPTNLVFTPIGRDGLTWASNKGGPAPKSLSQAQLVKIYTCKVSNWSQVGGRSAPINAQLPQTGSGTRKFFLKALGLPGVPVVPGKCVNSSPGESLTVPPPNGNFPEENEGYNKFVRPSNVIYPYSIAVYLAQANHSASCKTAGCKGPINPATGTPFCNKPKKGQNLFGCDFHVNMQLHQIDKVSPTVPFPVTSKSSLNLKFSLFFQRLVFVVTRKANGQAGLVPKYLQPLFGPAGWVLNNKTAAKDVCAYGFDLIAGKCP